VIPGQAVVIAERPRRALRRPVRAVKLARQPDHDRIRDTSVLRVPERFPQHAGAASGMLECGLDRAPVRASARQLLLGELLER